MPRFGVGLPGSVSHGPVVTHAPPHAKSVPPAIEGSAANPNALAMIWTETGSGFVVKLLPTGRPEIAAILPESERLSPNAAKLVNCCACAAVTEQIATASELTSRRIRGMDDS